MKAGKDYIGLGVGAIIVNRENKFFLNLHGVQAQNERGKWEFPGGKLEFGDDFEDTIMREIREEFGFDIETVEMLPPVNHLIPDEKQHWVAIAFLCRVKQGAPKILEPHKTDTIGWFTLSEIEKLDLTIISGDRLNYIKSHPSLLKRI